VLVDSGWAFGARLLYLSSPPLRGDDVEALQVRLARLGFHCGKADGVFGPLTVRGLTEFQHNTGLVPDGICGPVTVRALERTGGQSGSGPGVVAVREDERRRSAAEGEGAIRVAIGLRGAPRTSALATSRALRRLGHRVLVVDTMDDAAQATAANSFDSHAFVGLDLTDDTERVSYYRTATHESAGGLRLAVAIAGRIADEPVLVAGERQRILRDTAMVAVVCSFTDHTWATRCGDLAMAIHEWGRVGP
jgi:N-acetylmuramoyl-L-alanine amidase